MRRRAIRKYYIKGIRHIRYRRGHGVHSPFAFNFITKIIEEKFVYYGYAEADARRQEIYQNTLTIDEMRLQKVISHKQGTLLFRMVNYFKPNHILEMGTAWGASAIYLHHGHKTGNLHIIEPKTEIAQSTSQFIASLPITVHIGDEQKTLSHYLSSHCPNFVSIMSRNNANRTAQIFAQLQEHIHDQMVIVIHGIHSNTEMLQTWKQIKLDPNVRVTMDLYDLGIVMCNSKLNKHHYIVSF